MPWKAIAKAAQAEVLDSIPKKWRLDVDKYRSLTDVTSVPRTCGILSDAQLNITDLTGLDVVKHIESHELTAVQALEAFGARTAIAHQLANCLMDWFYDDGLCQAEELDKAFKETGKLKGPLHGVPIALKDFHFVVGRPTTTGYVSRRNFRPEHDSALVKTLRDAGAVFYCKTTMPQSGMAIETVSNLWGRTLNPYNTGLSAGGSSGGDAVLVALKGTPITPSTDLGGSIRVPAAFNGLYAIRPTSDRIPKGGMENMNDGQLSIKLSCGPICHSMEDLEAFTKIINAHPLNQHDPTSVPVPWRTLKSVERKLSIGLMKWDKVVMPHPPVLRALNHTKRALENTGHQGRLHNMLVVE
ncbi:amidase signature domain-containing protein [Fusarium venenatum]|uniref:amidase signature domain-containing protein n=1 Tax=Fusarium venenatum TaxID=56646 RepID=UPI001D5D597C|nr:amidase signature domain-containing protein [Fusarium venenatum]